MILKKLKPTTPGTRGTTMPFYRKLLSKGNEPHKKLTKGVHRSVGRGGRITMRHRGGGHKRLYREIDFLYDKKDIPAKVETIEYDPNRSSFISLLCYQDGERRYVITPKEMKVGATVITAEKAPIELGNRMMLRNIPIGTAVYNVELKTNGGAKLARSAGNAVTILGHDGKYSHLRLPSQEVRKVSSYGYASIGSVSNEMHRLRVIGKAGRNRWLGKRPTVRGSAMAPVDHPHGGGEGKQGRGRRRAVTKWGKPSGKGQKTRSPKKYSNPMIVRSRQKARRRR